MEKEIWKDIPGYEGLYQASTLGNIQSYTRKVYLSDGRVRTNKGRMLKLIDDTHGRYVVSLIKEKSKQYKVHYLIALTFIGERPKNTLVCHLDGDSKNNRLDNLRYDTAKENSIDIYRQGGKVGTAKLTIDEVLEIRKLHATGDYLQIHLAKMYNICNKSVSNIVNRKTFDWLNDDGSIDESKTAIK